MYANAPVETQERLEKRRKPVQIHEPAESQEHGEKKGGNPCNVTHTNTYSLTKNATPVSGSTRFTHPPPAAVPALGSAVGSEAGSAGASAK